MTFAAIMAILVDVLTAAPGLVTSVKAVIAAFESSGPQAAKDLIASKAAADTAAAEARLQTPVKP